MFPGAERGFVGPSMSASLPRCRDASVSEGASGAPFAAARLWASSRPFNKRKTLESHLFLFSIFPVTVQITSTGAVVWISVSNRNAPNFAAALCVVSRSLGLVWEGRFGALGWGWGSAGLGSLGAGSAFRGLGSAGGTFAAAGTRNSGGFVPRTPAQSVSSVSHQAPCALRVLALVAPNPRLAPKCPRLA